MECSCATCRQACHNRPGWFLPSDMEGAATAMGISLKELFQHYLVVDYFQLAGGDMTYVLAPAMAGCPTGTMAPFNPHGKCAFLGPDELCNIHLAKPKECSHYDHTILRESADRCRDEVVAAWQAPEAVAMIRELLGREPEAPVPSVLEGLGLLLDQMGGMGEMKRMLEQLGMR